MSEELTNQSETVTETQTTTEQATEQTTQTENTTQQTEQVTETQAPQTLKVKYNHEDREIPIEEAVVLAQKGMNFEKAVERAKQEARDAYIADQGYVWNDKPITTEAEYKEALREKEIYDSLANKGLPDEVMQELVESRKFREQSQAERQTKAAQEREDADLVSFFQANPTVKPEDITPQVWQEFKSGKSLVDAYTKHENAILKAKLAEYEKGKAAATANQANAATSTGSVTGQGATGEAHISFETFEANKHDSSWVMKNFQKINESRTKW